MFEAKNQFIGHYFMVEGFSSIYLCSAVDLDDDQNIMSITFFNRFRRDNTEPQTLTFDGNATFVRILDENLIARHQEFHEKLEMA